MSVKNRQTEYELEELHRLLDNTESDLVKRLLKSVMILLNYGANGDEIHAIARLAKPGELGQSTESEDWRGEGLLSDVVGVYRKTTEPQFARILSQFMDLLTEKVPASRIRLVDTGDQ